MTEEYLNLADAPRINFDCDLEVRLFSDLYWEVDQVHFCVSLGDYDDMPAKAKFTLPQLMVHLMDSFGTMSLTGDQVIMDEDGMEAVDNILKQLDESKAVMEKLKCRCVLSDRAKQQQGQEP